MEKSLTERFASALIVILPDCTFTPDEIHMRINELGFDGFIDTFKDDISPLIETARLLSILWNGTP